MFKLYDLREFQKDVHKTATEKGEIREVTNAGAMGQHRVFANPLN